MSKVKVLHVFNELRFSGAEVMYVSAANFFQRNNCELSALATGLEIGDFKGEFLNAGYKIYHQILPGKFAIINRLVFCLKLVRFLKQNHFDVVHCHPNGAYWIVSLATWLARKKCIYSFHSVFKAKRHTRFYHIIKRWTAKKIFKCVFHSISDSVYNNELSYFKNNTIKINNWYNNSAYYPASINEKELIRKELQIPNNSFVVISVGSCNHIKRHSEIILTIDQVRRRVPNIFYLHLGTGELEQNELALVNSLGLNSYIKYIGNIKNVRKYLIASDVYVMTSKHEGISLTTIEAMACGVPTILYNVPGLCDFNKFGDNSLLIEPNINYLADALSKFQEGFTFNSIKIGNAYKLVNTNYNLEINANQILQEYLRL